MFKMLTTGQSACIQTTLRARAASHPISAAAHMLAL